MKILRSFGQRRKGQLLQVMIALAVIGALSYSFWNRWETNMTTAGQQLKAKIESDNWLSP